jgi:hypothetical protein
METNFFNNNYIWNSTKEHIMETLKFMDQGKRIIFNELVIVPKNENEHNIHLYISNTGRLYMTCHYKKWRWI